MECVEKAYLPPLAHLNEVSCSPNNAAQKQFAKDTFKFMLSWEFCITLASCIDHLNLAWKTKLIFERRLNVRAPQAFQCPGNRDSELLRE